MICRSNGRLLGRGCRRHGGHRRGTKGRRPRVKLSAGIRMMVLLTLSKWHPGDREKGGGPPLWGLCSSASICFHLHSRASALWPPPLCRVAQSQLGPRLIQHFVENKVFFFLMLLLAEYLEKNPVLRINCAQDVQSDVLWSPPPSLSLLNGLQLIGLVPL